MRRDQAAASLISTHRGALEGGRSRWQWGTTASAGGYFRSGAAAVAGFGRESDASVVLSHVSNM